METSYKQQFWCLATDSQLNLGLKFKKAILTLGYAVTRPVCLWTQTQIFCSHSFSSSTGLFELHLFKPALLLLNMGRVYRLSCNLYFDDYVLIFVSSDQRTFFYLLAVSFDLWQVWIMASYILYFQQWLSSCSSKCVEWNLIIIYNSCPADVLNRG